MTRIHWMDRAVCAAVVVVSLFGVNGVDTSAQAATPQVEVLINNRRVIRAMADSVPSGTYTANSDYWVAYDVRNGSVLDTRVDFELPAGIAHFDSHFPAWGAWVEAEQAWKARTVGALSGMQVYEFDSYPTRVPVDLPYSAARTVSNPVMTSDTVTQTIGLDLTFDASFSGYEVGEVNLIAPWEAPDDFSYSITSLTAPTGWGSNAASADARQFYTIQDPAAFAGNTYHFEAVVDVTKTGPLAGVDTYHKPYTFLGFHTDTSHNVVGTSVTLPMSDGVSATFSASETVDFETHAGIVYDLDFRKVVASAGPASAQEIELVRQQRTTPSGTVLDGFWANVYGTSIVEATLTLPGGGVYAMEGDQGGDWDFGLETTDPANDLAQFVPGTYTFAITGTDGVTRDYDVELVAGDLPSDAPALDQGTGFSTSDPRPLLTWAAPTDPNVDIVAFMMESLGDGFDDELFGDTSLLGYTPGTDLDLGGYWIEHYFGDLVAKGTVDGAVYSVIYAKGRDSYINIVPEPASLSLLALGGLALLRRRRA